MDLSIRFFRLFKQKIQKIQNEKAFVKLLGVLSKYTKVKFLIDDFASLCRNEEDDIICTIDIFIQ